MVVRGTSQGVIGVADVEHIFDEACIARLAQIGRLPAHADLRRFREGVREAARSYAGEARNPNANALHTQIAELHRAAERRRFEELATLLRDLSPRPRALLNGRGLRPSLGMTLPEPERLLDGACREEACAVVARLCGFGARYVEGRMRPSRVRSRTWRPLLYAPEPRRHFPRRQAERYFLTCLRLAWLEAVGEAPSRAANPDRLGPFACMAKECFRLMGAGHVDIAGLINDLNRRRRASNKPRCS